MFAKANSMNDVVIRATWYDLQFRKKGFQGNRYQQQNDKNAHRKGRANAHVRISGFPDARPQQQSCKNGRSTLKPAATMTDHAVATKKGGAPVS